MKVQCSCGAKYEFDLTPVMATSPVKFVCPACGLDASEFVDSLVRRELGQSSTPRGVPVPVSLQGTAAVSKLAQTGAPTGVLLEDNAPPPRSGLAVRVHTPAAPAETVAPEPASVVGTPCLKHPGQLAVEKCFICSKPLCPKCMEMFGYVCSPLCKAKADSHGIKVPIFAGQKSVVEARLWRKVVWVGTSVGAIFVALFGFWIWYTWSGRLPRPIFSIRFPELVSSGQAVICGKNRDQIVYLHGSILARHDMKLKKQLWSRDLLDTNAIQAEIQQEIKVMKAAIDKANNEGWEHVPRMPDVEKLARQLARAQAEALQLHVRGENVWVGDYKKFERYDWDTGQPVKELAVNNRFFGGLISRGDELLMVDSESSRPMVTRINLATGETTVQDLNSPEAMAMAAASATGAVNSASGKPAKQLAGLPTVPGADMGKPMDPGKVAEQVSHLPLPAKYALPATLSSTYNQERALSEMKQDGEGEDSLSNEPTTSFSLIPTKDDFLQFAVKLKEARFAQHDAMKAPPKKSALDSGITAADSMKVANEMLNEMQRSRGGNVVSENVSLYQVTIRRPGSEDSWTGEVVGPPKLFPLDDVNVLTASKIIIVFDKHNKKLWQAPLTYSVTEGLGALDEESANYGRGPCVEHKGKLYVIDQGMLTAFDLATGNVRWRLPSVGIVGMFFDDKDMIYLNTTTASPESIKYSRQIDLNSQVASVVEKVDSRNGAVLWTAEPGGMINYVSGQVILAVQSYQVMEDEDLSSSPPETGFEASPYLRVRRINPRNGREMWEYYQKRAPVDIAFEKNIIRLVFRKEVQVLKFPTF
jgi:hypothetical protein